MSCCVSVIILLPFLVSSKPCSSRSDYWLRTEYSSVSYDETILPFGTTCSPCCAIYVFSDTWRRRWSCALLSLEPNLPDCCKPISLSFSTGWWCGPSPQVLTWLPSVSSRYQIFVAHRLTELFECTNTSNWRYVDLLSNQADDIARGKTLANLAVPHRFNQCPLFYICPSMLPVLGRLSGWNLSTHIVLGCKLPPTWEIAGGYPTSAAQHAQRESFLQEYASQQTGKAISTQSRLNNLAPEFHHTTNLIKVGGRLRMSEDLDYNRIHPVVLDPKSHITPLLFKKYNNKLHHPGPESFRQPREELLDFARETSNKETQALIHRL